MGKEYVDKVARSASRILWRVIQDRGDGYLRVFGRNVPMKSERDVVGLMTAYSFKPMWEVFTKNSGTGRRRRLRMSKALRQAGVTTLVDQGSGTISPDIPSQTVFLLSKYVDVAGVGNNIHGSKAKSTISHSQMTTLFVDEFKRLAKKIGMSFDPGYQNGDLYSFEDVSIGDGPEFDVKYSSVVVGSYVSIKAGRKKSYRQKIDGGIRSEVKVRKDLRTAIIVGLRHLGLLKPLDRTPMSMLRHG